MSLSIIMKNRLKVLEFLLNWYLHIAYLLGIQRMSFISAKLLAIEIIYNEVFNIISLPLEWHYSALMGSLRSAVLVCVCTQC